MYSSAAPASSLLLAKKGLFNRALRAIGFKTTQIFTDLETFTSRCANQPPSKPVIELMTHPGAEPSSEESRFMDTDWPRNLSYSAALISYKAL